MIIRKLGLISNGKTVSSNDSLNFRKADCEGLRKQLQRIRGVRSVQGVAAEQGVRSVALRAGMIV